MGVFEKLKNALFEVEYVEEEVPDKKCKEKPKETNDKQVEEDKPIAKKIVLPGNKEEKVEVIKEEELLDDNFEIRPKDSTVKSSSDSFRFMDDDDFKVDDDPLSTMPVRECPSEVVQQAFDETAAMYSPPSLEVVSQNVQNIVTDVTSFNMQSSDKDYNYVREYDSYKEKNTVDDYLIRSKESKPYGMDPSYQVSIKQYGSYESRDEKTYFKPSPIISPIYGILDKNYKKEDVVSKKTTRSTPTATRSNVSVDDVRNKAYSGKSDDYAEEPIIESSFEVEEDDGNLLVDLNNEHEKPEVREITVGDAVEYFDDLGLEYNVDYVDASNKKKKATDLCDDIKNSLGEEEIEEGKIPVEELTPKMTLEEKEIHIPDLSGVNLHLHDNDSNKHKDKEKDKEKEKPNFEEKSSHKDVVIKKFDDDIDDAFKKDQSAETVATNESKSNDASMEKKSPIVEVMNDTNTSTEEDDDNLFDLIDSMYKEDK